MANYSRQLDILNPDMIVFPVTIIGLGHIGSNVAHELAALGFEQITLYDDDKIEDVNFPGQLYRDPLDFGKFKVEAAKEILRLFHQQRQVKIFKEKFLGQRQLEGIVVSGVDSMESRKAIWEAVRSNIGVPLYIDGRTGGEIIECHTLRPCQIEDVEDYEKTLQHQGVPLPCGGQSIGYAGRIIAGLIASQLKKWLKKEEYFQKLIFNIGEGVFVQEGPRNFEGGEIM